MVTVIINSWLLADGESYGSGGVAEYDYTATDGIMPITIIDSALLQNAHGPRLIEPWEEDRPRARLVMVGREACYRIEVQRILKDGKPTFRARLSNW